MSVNELLMNPDQAELQRKAEREFVWPMVAVGEPGILWFPHADKNCPPSPAVVNEESNGVLTLTVLPKNAMPFTKTGVRHVDDPFHKTHPQSRAKNGGWDYYTKSLTETRVAKQRQLLKEKEKQKARQRAELEAAEAGKES